MDSQHIIFIATAVIAFGVALLAVITQWLKADDVAADIEQDVRTQLVAMKAVAADALEGGQLASPEPVPLRLSEDETALSRLFLAWGTAGMVVGLGLGAATGGPVGALLGGVVMVAVSIGLVVLGVLAVERARERHAQEREEAHNIATGPVSLVPR